MTTPQIVASARRALTDAQAAHQAATDKAVAIEQRITDSRTVLDGITARRLAGNITPADVAEFAVVSADLVALQKMMDSANADVAAADTSPARQNLQRAEKELETENTREAFNALSHRASQLDTALCRCVADLHSHGQRLGIVSLIMSWTPSQKLAEAIKYGRPPI